MRMRRGLTIAETVVSMFLLTMLLVYILSVFPFLRQGVEQSQTWFNAATVGHNLLESARLTGFDNVAASTGSQTFTGTTGGSTSTQTINYTVTVTTSSTTKKVITAKMTWHDVASHNDQSLIVETILVKT